jgi:hypothetical protein
MAKGMTKAAPLKWKQDGYLHFAHAREGMYTIEQHRKRFIVTLTLENGSVMRGDEQQMGTYASLALAKKSAEQDHRALSKLD